MWQLFKLLPISFHMQVILECMCQITSRKIRERKKEREREWRNERKGRRPLALAHEGMANPLTLKPVHVPSQRRRRWRLWCETTTSPYICIKMTIYRTLLTRLSLSYHTSFQSYQKITSFFFKRKNKDIILLKKKNTFNSWKRGRK